jgi:AcrR family transcriptional regulator
MDPQQRREAILDAALVVIARSGFAGTTLRDVAAQAGVAHGLLRHHFGTREALLAAAFDQAAGAEIAGLDQRPDDPIDAVIDYLQPPSPAHYLLWIDAWSEAPRNRDLARTLAHHHRACDEHLRQIVREGSDRGVFIVDDLESATIGLVALQDGLAVQEFGIGLLDREGASRIALAQAERLLGCVPRTLVGRQAAPPVEGAEIP